MTARNHTSQSPLTAIAGRYRVLEELGRGGTAVVYRVHDISTSRELALKQLLVPVSQVHAQEAAALFEREYYALAQLAHPRVIAVYDYGVDVAGRFYTMELLDGGDLKQLSPMPARRSCQLMLEVCSSLALLHSRRLVHRDVTPRNVRCTRDGHAKLIDFGSMTPMGPCANVAGTPAFIAPEVLQKVSLDGRADLFSLGATLYYTLTGRPPFVVRNMSELREAYARELVAPSLLAKGIPPALDALVLSLLRIDPEQRPPSAFEVMHKLEAILGTPHEEPLGVSQAYLTTPLLCGREAQLRAFRQRIRPAIHGRGGALLFKSPAGLGRSRLLDACALEAKTLGVTVLRAGAGSSTAFAAAARVCEQIVEALPDVAVQAAERVQVHTRLFESAEPGAPARLIRLDDSGCDRERVLPALSAWLACICETRALTLLIDDVQRLDEASLSWLASLAVAAPELRLQLTLTAETNTQTASAAANVLARHCDVVELQPLTHAETEVLLGSVFGKVPHLPRLTEQLYRVARGSPRETLLLAQHLVDAGGVSYRDGRWTLPAALQPGDLPASASEALRARIAALPALARQLAQAQALLGMRSLRAAEYASLVPDAPAAAIDAALLALLSADILQSDGERFQLSQPALVDVLSRMLDAREKQAVHERLYELHVRAGETHPYVLVPQLVAAGRHADALAIMAARGVWLDSQAERAILGVDARSVAESLERLLHASAAVGCSAREAHELRRRLCALAVAGDDALHARVSPAWLAQLRLDSGLSDYRASRVEEPAERLRGALELARARHAAAPELTRVYTVEEAIRYLGVYVVTAIVISVRTADTRLMRSLPELMEPFAMLSPALHAIWQNVLGLVEAHVLNRRVSATRRHRQVYERLRQLDADAMPYIGAICGALAHSVGSFEAYLGSPAAFEWAALLDDDPLQCVAAMEIRRSAYLVRGDAQRADLYERQAELLALRSEVRRMFDRSWPGELELATLTTDLARIKRVCDEALRLSVEHPAWQPLFHAAEGYFKLLRGEPAAALAAFDRSLAQSDAEQAELPNQLDVWLQASAGAVRALSALGRDAIAVQRAEDALARCQAIGVELGWHRIARALALAEANLGQLPRAVLRIERLIEAEETDGLHGLHRATTYEVRARLALQAREVPVARRYALLALQASGGESCAAAWSHLSPLLDEAKKLGLDLDLGPTRFELAVLGSGSSRVLEEDAAAPATEHLRSSSDPCARALELLCGSARAQGGHLFLVDVDGELTLKATRTAAPPSSDALEFVQGFFAQQLDDALISDFVTRATHMLSLPGVAMYYGDDGSDRHVIVLSCKLKGELVLVGVALVDMNPDASIRPETVVHANALALELLALGASPGARAAPLS